MAYQIALRLQEKSSVNDLASIFLVRLDQNHFLAVFYIILTKGTSKVLAVLPLLTL